nr:unnamed protein product [Digitaria exilis]
MSFPPQGFNMYGGGPTLNPAPISEQEAFRQIFMALEQSKQQALHQMVQAVTGGSSYPSQYPFYNYNAPATPSPNARYGPTNATNPAEPASFAY